MKTLHLTLKAQWYNMIESGEKKEEYREIKPYWANRLLVGYDGDSIGGWASASPTIIQEQINNGFILIKCYDKVCFHFGYTNRTMTYEIKSISIGNGSIYWGAEDGKQYFIISLGERIKEK